MNNKKSHVVDIKKIIETSRAIARHFSDDDVPVYAAQASFFMLSSSIPFIMLILSLGKYVFPDTLTTVFDALQPFIPDKMFVIFENIRAELTTSNGIPLLSVTAIIALWSSSKSIRSIVRGVANIYDAENIPGFFKNSLYSLVYTLIFLLVVMAALIILVFGVTIRNLITSRFPGTDWVFSLVLSLRGLVFFVLLTLFFSLLFYAVARRLVRASGTLRRYRSQIPGAAFASAGWMIFSYGYSIYLQYFPTASYIYGSLAALTLLLFWLYFCMMILLAGAEINKLLNR